MTNDHFSLNKFTVTRAGTVIEKRSGNVFMKEAAADPNSPSKIVGIDPETGKPRRIKLKNSVVVATLQSFLDGATILRGSAAAQAGAISRRLKSLGFDRAETYSTATFFEVKAEGFEVSRLGYSNRVVLDYRVKGNDRELRAAKVRELRAALESKGIFADSRGHYVTEES